jgi:hypothetical protein
MDDRFDIQMVIGLKESFGWGCEAHRRLGR